jgi:hypothetical protein
MGLGFNAFQGEKKAVFRCYSKKSNSKTKRKMQQMQKKT